MVSELHEGERCTCTIAKRSDSMSTARSMCCRSRVCMGCVSQWENRSMRDSTHERTSTSAPSRAVDKEQERGEIKKRSYNHAARQSFVATSYFPNYKNCPV